MSAYYNEIDPFAAEWLRNLISAGLIAPGDVDTRSIEDVRSDDLESYTQCHFFAGIGVWSWALRRAGWPDDSAVWTGSCPCQPFSAAGQQAGHDDPRHLWPEWFRLIRECRPAVVFGEQVASAIRHGWLDLVQGDLEGEGYACGSAVLGAHSVGAPHIRQRLWFVAERKRKKYAQGSSLGEYGIIPMCDMADSDNTGPQGRGERWDGAEQRPVGPGGVVDGMAHDTPDRRREERPDAGGLAARDRAEGRAAGPESSGLSGGASPTNGFWRDADWLFCRDGKWRPAKPCLKPLVVGSSSGVVRGGDPGEPIDADYSTEARVQRLRGYGNAIVAPVAETFIRAYMDTRA